MGTPCNVPPDGHLRADESLALVVQLGVGLAGLVAPDPGLHRAHELVDLSVGQN